MNGILDTLIRNSRKSIDDGVYDLNLTESLQKISKKFRERNKIFQRRTSYH